MPFPPNFPVYIPKDKLANWFEAYAEAMELNYWTGTDFEGGDVRRARRALVGACCAAPTARSASCIRATW